MATLEPRERIASVDILRGLVMIVMALDHVRDFWSVAPFRPEDLTQTSTTLFFTRWITHFCAPVFSFLSGISIYFTQQRLPSKRALSMFLLKRGFWLIALQLFVLSFLLQFSFNMVILEVIWALGWSMVFMAGFIWLPRWAVAAVGGIMIAGHNLLPNIDVANGGNVVLAMLHNVPSFVMVPGGPGILIAYTIVPWVGVMMMGYVAGTWFTLPEERQVKTWRMAGLILLASFVLLRFINVYGDPVPWASQPRGAWFTFLSFISISKYPPSLLFLLLTLGVACLALSFLHRASGTVVEFVKTFGAVPFFYYLLHIPLIVSGAYLWAYLRFGVIVSFSFQPPDQWPAGYEPSLLRTYTVWIIYLILLYFPCRWYAAYKRESRGWWLSYV